MKTLSLSEVKMKLSELVEKVYSTDEEVVITKNGRPSAVLVSPDEFESWKETLEIISDRDMMDEILSHLLKLFLTRFNEFINHRPKPFRPIIDRVMKL